MRERKENDIRSTARGGRASGSAEVSQKLRGIGLAIVAWQYHSLTRPELRTELLRYYRDGGGCGFATSLLCPDLATLGRWREGHRQDIDQVEALLRRQGPGGSRVAPSAMGTGERE